MPSNQIEQKKIETYAQVLLEAARQEGRIAADLEVLRALSDLPGEIFSLLEVMCEQGDISLIAQVADSYAKLVDCDTDTLTAEVTSAVELTEELRNKITDKLSADFGRDIYLIEKVDPSILGGLIINVAGMRRDVSVKTQLETARQALSDAIQSGGDK